MEQTPAAQVEPRAAKLNLFHQASHIGCVFFLLLLAAIVAGNGVLFVQRLLQPVRQVTGTPDAVEETQRGARTSYGFTLETEQGELYFLHVRNHGRVLKYLQEMLVPQMVTVRYRDGHVLSLRSAAEDGREITEQEAPLALHGGVVLLSLLILAFMTVVAIRYWRLALDVTPGVGKRLDEEE